MSEKIGCVAVSVLGVGFIAVFCVLGVARSKAKWSGWRSVVVVEKSAIADDGKAFGNNESWTVAVNDEGNMRLFDDKRIFTSCDIGDTLIVRQLDGPLWGWTYDYELSQRQP